MAKCSLSVVAGGGFQGGQWSGHPIAGREVADRLVSPADLIGSIYELLGINLEATLPHPQGLKIPVMPENKKAPGSAGRLREIMRSA